MVNDHNKTEDIVVFEDKGNGSYLIRWGITPMMEKDEDGNETASALSTYTMEMFDYKPSADILVDLILKSGRNASTEEFKAICEGFGIEPLEPTRKLVLGYIAAYDNSPAVNAFILNGNTVAWSSDDSSTPNKNVRMGLRQNIADKITKGEENITMWLAGMSVTMPCTQAESLMCNLEDYAYECFNVTASHKAAVAALTTIEEVLAYDYTTGYPDKLNISL